MTNDNTRRDSLGYPLTPDQSARMESKECSEAAAFVENPQYEQMIRLRTQDPAAFNRIAAGPNRIALSGYERAKNLAAKYSA
jgi:hypothetical protein